MDKQSGRKRATVAIVSAACAVLAVILLFVLPGATRLALVAGQGILAADFIRTSFYVVGALFGGAAGAGATWTAVQIVGDRRKAKQLERRKAYQLPSRSETDPDVIGEHLAHVADVYPELDKLIGESLEQLRLLRQHLANIDQIFEVNAGLLSHGDSQFEFGKFGYLLKRVIEEATRDLNGIVYQAFARTGDSQAPLVDLADAIREANTANWRRIKAARKLSDRAAELVVKFEGEAFDTTATEEIQNLIVRLDETNRKKVF